jgi:hypothetical protein
MCWQPEPRPPHGSFGHHFEVGNPVANGATAEKEDET